ncbi:hypothetical protein DFH06DRAFT_1130008 [Mycena polygramma]|nr:hypothetical protein DFH06DRAFT_1130008 [Mycena polygramma]
MFSANTLICPRVMADGGGWVRECGGRWADEYGSLADVTAKHPRPVTNVTTYGASRQISTNQKANKPGPNPFFLFYTWELILYMPRSRSNLLNGRGHRDIPVAFFKGNGAGGDRDRCFKNATRSLKKCLPRQNFSMSRWSKCNAMCGDRDRRKKKQRNGPRRDRDRCFTTGTYSIADFYRPNEIRFHTPGGSWTTVMDGFGTEVNSFFGEFAKLKLVIPQWHRAWRETIGIENSTQQRLRCSYHLISIQSSIWRTHPPLHSHIAVLPKGYTYNHTQGKRGGCARREIHCKVSLKKTAITDTAADASVVTKSTKQRAGGQLVCKHWQGSHSRARKGLVRSAASLRVFSGRPTADSGQHIVWEFFFTRSCIYMIQADRKMACRRFNKCRTFENRECLQYPGLIKWRMPPPPYMQLSKLHLRHFEPSQYSGGDPARLPPMPSEMDLGAMIRFLLAEERARQLRPPRSTVGRYRSCDQCWNAARRHGLLEPSNLTKEEASARRMGPLRPPLLIQPRAPKRPFTACWRLLLRCGYPRCSEPYSDPWETQPRRSNTRGSGFPTDLLAGTHGPSSEVVTQAEDHDGLKLARKTVPKTSASFLWVILVTS